MKSKKRSTQKRTTLFFIYAALALLYFIIRIPHITYLPIFNDEAFYMRWAQMIVDDGTQAMIPLAVGRQPLFIWAAALVMEIVHDPILPGRIVSIITGFLTMIGLMLITFSLFKERRTVIIMGLLYIFYPFAHVHDRLGILESMVGMFVVWSLWLSIILVRTVRIDIAYTLGFVIGGGLLTKANALFCIYMLPLLILIFPNKKLFAKFFRFFALCVLAVGVAFVVQGITYFHPDNWRILAANGIFIYPVREWIPLSLAMKISVLLDNLKFFGSVFYDYYTIPYLLLLIYSIVTLKQYPREKLLLILYSIVPFLIFCIFARLQTPRYIYTMTLTLLPLVAISLSDVIGLLERHVKISKDKKYVIPAIVCIIVFLYPAYYLYLLSYNFYHAPVPKPDISQYYSSQGFFTRDFVNFITKQAENKKVAVFVDNYNWISQTTVLFLGKNPNVSIHAKTDLKHGIPRYVRESAKKNLTFLVSVGDKHATYLVPHSFSTSPVDYRLYKVLP